MIKSFLTPLVAAAGVFALAMAANPAPAQAQNVTVTPLGSHDGEFCRNDRALLFEDPTGDTLLYDPGRTVRGGDDPRLPEILTVLLLTSVHSDHIGDVHPTSADQGTCASPGTTNADLPNSNVDLVLAAHPETKIWVGGEMSGFFGARHPGQAQTLRPGGTRTTANGVKVSVVPAFHSNGLSPSFLTGNSQLTNPGGNQPNGLSQNTLPGELSSSGLTAYVGPDHGYIIRFTNGLTVYLTGDTGQFGDMKHIVRDFYGPQLAVVHLGGTFGMGVDEGIFATDSLIQPTSVIVTHVNEEATVGGVLQPGSTQDFVTGVATPAFVPRSGIPLCFDGGGNNVAC